MMGRVHSCLCSRQQRDQTKPASNGHISANHPRAAASSSLLGSQGPVTLKSKSCMFCPFPFRKNSHIIAGPEGKRRLCSRIRKKSHPKKGLSSSLCSVPSSDNSEKVSQCEQMPSVISEELVNSSMPKQILNSFYHYYEAGADHHCYRNSVEPIMPPEGIMQLLIDLNLDPKSFPVLVLAWLCRAERMCELSLTEWGRGLLSLQTKGSIEDLRTDLIRYADKVVQDSTLFNEIYAWSFKFALEHCNRSLDIQTAVDMWYVLWPVGSRPPVVEKWCAYLTSLHEHWVMEELSRSEKTLENRIKQVWRPEISRDTWLVFLKFVHQVGTEYSLYSTSDAWPTLIDQFVEHELEQSAEQIDHT